MGLKTHYKMTEEFKKEFLELYLFYKKCNGIDGNEKRELRKELSNFLEENNTPKYYDKNLNIVYNNIVKNPVRGRKVPNDIFIDFEVKTKELCKTNKSIGNMNIYNLITKEYGKIEVMIHKSMNNLKDTIKINLNITSKVGAM